MDLKDSIKPFEQTDENNRWFEIKRLEVSGFPYDTDYQDAELYFSKFDLLKDQSIQRSEIKGILRYLCKTRKGMSGGPVFIYVIDIDNIDESETIFLIGNHIEVCLIL